MTLFAKEHTSASSNIHPSSNSQWCNHFLACHLLSHCSPLSVYSCSVIQHFTDLFPSLPILPQFFMFSLCSLPISLICAFFQSQFYLHGFPLMSCFFFPHTYERHWSCLILTSWSWAKASFHWSFTNGGTDYNISLLKARKSGSPKNGNIVIILSLCCWWRRTDKQPHSQIKNNQSDKEKRPHTSSVCVFSFFALSLSGEWTDFTTFYYDCHLTFDPHS